MGIEQTGMKIIQEAASTVKKEAGAKAEKLAGSMVREATTEAERKAASEAVSNYQQGLIKAEIKAEAVKNAQEEVTNGKNCKALVRVKHQSSVTPYDGISERRKFEDEIAAEIEANVKYPEAPSDVAKKALWCSTRNRVIQARNRFLDAKKNYLSLMSSVDPNRVTALKSSKFIERRRELLDLEAALRKRKEFTHPDIYFDVCKDEYNDSYYDTLEALYNKMTELEMQLDIMPECARKSACSRELDLVKEAINAPAWELML